MTKTKKNKSILKRILAFLGAGVCALACMLTFGYNSKIIVNAQSTYETFTYNASIEHIKVTNLTSFSKNIVDINDFVSGDIVSDGKKYGNSDIYFRTNSFISVSSNSKYTLNYHGANNLLLVGVKTYTTTDMSTGSQYLNISTFPSTFVIPNNINYIKIVIQPQNVGSLNDIDIQLEAGEVATSYVPYQQNASFTLKSVFSFLPLENNQFRTQVTLDIKSDLFNYAHSNDNTFGLDMYYMANFNFLFEFHKVINDIIQYNNKNYFFLNCFNMASTAGELFNGNVVKIVKGSYKNYNLYFTDLSNYPYAFTTLPSKVNGKFNFISYVCKNGASITLVIPLLSNLDLDYFDLTTYFLEGGVSDSYNDGYYNGRTTGYSEGYQKGTSNGYSTGYDKGKKDGFNTGYSKGVGESNDYTFLGLLSACIDAPITYFTSLFNFELLGVNLSAFLTGLFTLCVIVTIVRLVLGGK